MDGLIDQLVHGKLASHIVKSYVIIIALLIQPMDVVNQLPDGGERVDHPRRHGSHLWEGGA